MAVLRTPDGTTLQVPDNATPEQVQQIFSAYRDDTSNQARDAEWDAMPWYQKAAVGFAKPLVETGLGIKDLVTDLNQDEKNLVEAGQGVRGVAGTAGEVAGNMVTFAAPGGAAAKVTSGLPRAAKLAGQVAAAAGTEALKAPTEERSRAAAAKMGALGATAGSAMGHLFKKTLAGITKSDAARRLASDIPLTPGMASGGRFVPWAERRMAALPVVGGKVAKLQANALREWNKKTLQSAAPVGAKVTSAGREGFAQLQKAYKAAYARLWNNSIQFKNPSHALSAMTAHASRLLSKNELGRLNREMTQVHELLEIAEGLMSRGKNNGEILSQIDDLLRGFASQASRKGKSQLADVYKAARQTFRSALPEDVRGGLAELDHMYARYAVVQRAGTYKKSLENDQVFTPSDLLGAVKAKGNDRALSRGEALLQDEALDAVKVFDGLTSRGGKVDKGLTGLAVGTATYVEPMTAGALLAGTALPTEVMRKIATGYYRTRPQELANVLAKYGVTPATAGAATTSSASD